MVAGALAEYSVCPREGHMAMVLKVFACCRKYLYLKPVFDAYDKDFADTEWISGDWKRSYPDISEKNEVIPDNAPEPIYKAVQINLFCDASHAVCLETRRSTTGIVVFINGALIIWYIKRQNTIKSSAFGSEFVALKIATELNEGLRYKLNARDTSVRTDELLL